MIANLVPGIVAACSLLGIGLIDFLANIGHVHLRGEDK